MNLRDERRPLTSILSPGRGEEIPLALSKGEGVPAVACRLAEEGQGEGFVSRIQRGSKCTERNPY